MGRVGKQTKLNACCPDPIANRSGRAFVELEFRDGKPGIIQARDEQIQIIVSIHIRKGDGAPINTPKRREWIYGVRWGKNWAIDGKDEFVPQES